MRVIADRNIPFLEGVLEPYCEVEYLKGGEISPESVRNADALLVRTRTKCDAGLLEGSSVRFIATATIGTDHLDIPYLRSRNIAFANAPGCNAGGVMQYVFTALFAVADRKGLDLKGKTIGVIGVGNTGGRVADLGEKLGFRVLRNDPPKARTAGAEKDRYCSLEQLLEESDIVTCHVPLDASTRGMASASFFSRMKPGAVFINASRGEVVVDEALLQADLSALILDVWNGEPDRISPALMTRADLATPHIAGYSLEGKMNGTMMAVRALAAHFNLLPLMDYTPVSTPGPLLQIPENWEVPRMSERLLEIFPIFQLDSALRSDPGQFEKIRSEYNYRREFKISL